jgi:hypothetical protein
MKTKNFNKKLRLNKKTVVKLTDKSMEEANGGGHYSWTICKTCGDECGTDLSCLTCPWYCP